MNLNIYQVDAFTDKLFKGNPAAVVPLSKWLDDSLMQEIATENNLSETAFFVKENSQYHIRWFTPTTEVDLCGHATLASSFVIFNFHERNSSKIIFNSKSGKLIVTRKDEIISLNFPANSPTKFELTKQVLKCFPIKPIEYLRSNFDLIVFESEDFIKNYKPKINELKKLHPHGVIITAKGNEVDFVSRVFVPNEGIDEDPVTGSAHTILVPYWSSVLNKKKLIAEQLSQRGGKLYLKNNGSRIIIAGKAILYSKGKIFFNKLVKKQK